MDLGLKEKVAVVTGASRGIGRATARMLCAEGADVLLVARSEERLVEAADECAAAADAGGGRAESLAIDVTQSDAADRIVREADERLGQLDVLVNNAGTARRRDLDEVPDEDWYAAWERDVTDASDAGRSSADGRSRLGPDRQRLQLFRQAPVGGYAGVLRGEGRRALPLTAVR
jgi:3-oxoacyl-[acyl-carrier protein] reductase